MHLAVDVRVIRFLQKVRVEWVVVQGPNTIQRGSHRLIPVEDLYEGRWRSGELTRPPLTGTLPPHPAIHLAQV